MAKIHTSLRHTVLLCILMLCSLPTTAQFLSWDDFVEQLFVEAESEGEEAAAMAENLYDDYAYLHAHPININRADSTGLQRLGFLTDRQIEGIHYYIYRYGTLRSVGELMLIPELDYHTRQLLSYFVTFGEPEEKREDARDTWHRMLTGGRSELSSRLDVPLYRRAGYAPHTQSQLETSPSRYYMGNALYHNLRYTYRGNTRGNLFGAHLGHSAHGLHVGLTVLYQSFNRRFAPPTQAYKRYAPQGHSFFNASADYAWHHHRLSITGETAVDGKGSIATLNMIRLKATDGLYLTLLQRYYAHDFWALEGKSFSTSSEIRGEQGIYLGTEWQPHRRFVLTAYADAYHYPYLRYRVAAPSHGTDGVVNARYTISNGHTLQLRYRFRLKQRDVVEGYRLLDGALFNEWTHRLRLQWNSTLTPLLTCQALIEGCLVQAETLSIGTMASAQATYSPTLGHHALRLSAGLTAFRADYAARLYGYERGLLYAYNYQMYYGTGLRGYLLIQYSHKETPRLTATAKVGATHYLDRNTIGSGATMIDACHREDVQLQVRYTF